MAYTSVTADLQRQEWDKAFLMEYVRESRFRPYMGKVSAQSGPDQNPLAPILVRMEGKGKRYTTIPLLTKATGNGKQGNEVLSGAEEAVGNYAHIMNMNFNRNAFAVSEADESWTEMDLRAGMRMLGKQWAAEALRDDLIISLMAPDGVSRVRSRTAATLADSVLTPAAWFANQISANQAGLDTWLEENVDRVLFGPDPTHTEGDFDFSDSVVKLTDGTDAMTAATIREAKKMARTASPIIRPTRVDDEKGREFYVMFMSSDDFDNIKQDSDIKAYNTDARTRGVEDHPLFQDGDLIYDGVILREVPEIPSAGAIGAGSADLVSMSFLCGAQALSVAWGMKPESRRDKNDDYGHKFGVGITESRGASKNFFNSKQHGVVSVFSTAAPNS